LSFLEIVIVVVVFAIFNHMMLYVSVAIPVVMWLSVCHTPVLYQNGYRYHQTYFSAL